MIECKICNTSYENVRKFSKHINFYHDIDLESYYYSFISHPSKCVICKTNDTRFVNYTYGYSDCCARKCSAIYHRYKLKQDKTKFDAFSSKVSSNMKLLWKNTDTTERCVAMSKSMNNTISKMTTEERKYKFGWINRLSLTDRNDFISNVIMNTGCHFWWKTASSEDKSEVYNRRAITLSNTWDTRGNVIMSKMSETFTRNSKSLSFYTDINDESYITMDTKLSKIFQLQYE